VADSQARRFGLAAAATARREAIHFWRERSRVLGFALSPLLFWFVVGSGFSDMAFFFPGAVLLSVLFTALFSTMSVIDDRRAGFLLSVLASPAPRAAFVLGKVAGGAAMAALQGLLFVAAGAALKPEGAPLPVWQPLATLLLTGFAFTAIGFWLAWHSRTPQGFHAIMNVVLMPLWMISGALFPLERAQPWLQTIMRLNPMRYFLDLFRHSLTPWHPGPGADPGLAAAVCLATAVLAACLSVYAVERRPYGVNE
jgi:ABC-2 type transport system permease protein